MLKKILLVVFTLCIGNTITAQIVLPKYNWKWNKKKVERKLGKPDEHELHDFSYKFQIDTLKGHLFCEFEENVLNSIFFTYNSKEDVTNSFMYISDNLTYKYGVPTERHLNIVRWDYKKTAIFLFINNFNNRNTISLKLINNGRSN